MGRVAKKVPEVAVEESPTQTVTQSRTRRTPKPNPKYANESIVALPKDEGGASEGEEKSAEPVKAAKSAKKEPVAVQKTPKTPATRGRPVKKQKIEYDEEEEEETASADAEKDEEDEKPVQRSTRSAKLAEPKESMKVGDDSVAIVDVSSIISKAPETPKNPKAAGRKRAVPEESPKEDLAKKKKEEEKVKVPPTSLITSRKSYMPAAKKSEEEPVEEVEAVKTPASTIKTRRNAGASAESSQSEPAEKKPKVEAETPSPAAKPAVKVEEPKKLPMVRKNEQITKVVLSADKTTPVLPTKTINNNTTTSTTTPKPVPRLLNSMVTPKGKQSPNVKLAGDGSDKKVFSIDLTDDSIKEKKIVVSPVKSPQAIVRAPPVAVKENVANNKPLVNTLLKTKLESELNRMKASASLARRHPMPSSYANRQSVANQQRTQLQTQSSGNLGPRRITKFESWYVIDVKNSEPTPFRHTHTHSLINLGNHIKELQLPSGKWDYKVTLQKRLTRENNNEEEVYTGDVTDKTLDAQSLEPSTILFKRSHRENNKVTIDRSLMLKANMYTITMNGKQCKLIGAPEDIKSLEDLEILLNIVDSASLLHSCVELVTQQDIITIH